MPSLTTLLLQIGVILVFARAVGWLLGQVGQPQVVGEMIAGILLGPSLFGWLAPDLSANLFPPSSLAMLSALSQIGLLLFMFLVGLEFNPQSLRGQGHTAVVISYVSIIIPFLLGMLLALYLYPLLSENTIPFTHFALFLGMAMSITAFPVLARILTERGLLKSPVGMLAIVCAAVDDVTAWCILAGVVFLVRAATMPASVFWWTLLGSIIYLGVMVAGARRPLQKLLEWYHAKGGLTQDILAVTLLLVLISATITEWLGIHALFGAFLLGALMPKEHSFMQALTSKLEDMTVVLLLPLFFAFTGLRTSVGALHNLEMWAYTGLIVVVAIVGKLGGATISARMLGMRWQEATAIGVLMNTRGLMELVVLNIGLDLGVISPTVFTMMVFMALITTLMTTPLLEWIYPSPVRQQQARSIVTQVEP